MGDMPALDAIMHDGLLDAFEHVNMIHFGTEGARKFEISREEQDEWALRSHERAAADFDRGNLRSHAMPFAKAEHHGISSWASSPKPQSESHH